MSRSVELLVHREVLRWQEAQRIAETNRDLSIGLKQRPMICISREYGSRGLEFGKMLAEQLGWSCHEQDIVDEIAKRADVRANLVHALDEKVKDSIVDRVRHIFETEDFSETDYLKNLTAVVTAFGRTGNGVIVGRGAHLILESHATLKVRMIAPMPVRAKFIAERDQISIHSATDICEQIDRERSTFYRDSFKVDVAAPEHYDLVLNTGMLNLGQCAEIVSAALDSKFKSANLLSQKSGVHPAAQAK